MDHPVRTVPIIAQGDWKAIRQHHGLNSTETVRLVNELAKTRFGPDVRFEAGIVRRWEEGGRTNRPELLYQYGVLFSEIIDNLQKPGNEDVHIPEHAPTAAMLNNTRAFLAGLNAYLQSATGGAPSAELRLLAEALGDISRRSGQAQLMLTGMIKAREPRQS